MSKKTVHSSYRMLSPVKDLHRFLLAWFDGHQRKMPWRETKDPYAIWLSETMLQQTQVETVKPFYHKFLAAFPTVGDLARAELQQVLSLWAGLGYYRRAKHLHVAAQRMVALHGGKVPGDVASLLSLPGIGRYTAGAVASIAFEVEAPVVDGNVIRVISRLTGFSLDVAEPRHRAFFWETMEKVIAGARKREGKNRKRLKMVGGLEAGGSGRFGDVNQAVMELGATVCVPGVPRCGECPVRGFCVANKEGRQGELPVKGKRGKVAVVRGAAVVIVRSQKTGVRSQREEVLLMQRGVGGVWEGMWEFPVLGEFGERADGKGAEEGQNRINIYRNELHVDMYIKNGQSVEGGRGGGAGGVGRWVEGVLGVRVKRVVECGEVVHVLTHRRMELRVVRVEVGMVEEERDGMKIKMRMKMKKGGGTVRGVGLPVGVDGVGYVGMRWVGWPLVRGGELAGVPMARVVWKVAERAEGGRLSD